MSSVLRLVPVLRGVAADVLSSWQTSDGARVGNFPPGTAFSKPIVPVV